MESSGTFSRIYQIIRQIPRGKVTTYGQVALLLGNPRMARVVGYALRACKEGDALPWHRVVNRRGEFSVESVFPGGASLQQSLLAQEGIPFTSDGRVDLRRCMWYGINPENYPGEKSPG